MPMELPGEDRGGDPSPRPGMRERERERERERDSTEYEKRYYLLSLFTNILSQYKHFSFNLLARLAHSTLGISNYCIGCRFVLVCKLSYVWLAA